MPRRTRAGERNAGSRENAPIGLAEAHADPKDLADGAFVIEIVRGKSQKLRRNEGLDDQIVRAVRHGGRLLRQATPDLILQIDREGLGGTEKGFKHRDRNLEFGKVDMIADSLANPFRQPVLGILQRRAKLNEYKLF